MIYRVTLFVTWDDRPIVYHLNTIQHIQFKVVFGSCIIFIISLLAKQVLNFVVDFVPQSQCKLIIYFALDFCAACNFSKSKESQTMLKLVTHVWLVHRWVLDCWICHLTICHIRWWSPIVEWLNKFKLFIIVIDSSRDPSVSYLD
jgi:hypothetical protein